jgi:hypothetical protein
MLDYKHKATLNTEVSGALDLSPNCGNKLSISGARTPDVLRLEVQVLPSIAIAKDI